MSVLPQRQAQQSTPLTHRVIRSAAPLARWGLVRTSSPRFGVANHRLIVLAPGATRSEYRLLVLHQEMPWIAMLAALPALLLLPPVAGPLGAVLSAAAVASACGALSAHLSRAVRRQSAQIDTCIGLDEHPLPSRAAERVRIEVLAVLGTAEQDLRAGRITPAQLETVWAGAHAEVQVFSRDPRRRPAR